MAKGRTEDSTKARLETAKAFLTSGLSLEKIAECCKLPLETVQQLAKETNS